MNDSAFKWTNSSTVFHTCARVYWKGNLMVYNIEFDDVEREEAP